VPWVLCLPSWQHCEYRSDILCTAKAGPKEKMSMSEVCITKAIMSDAGLIEMIVKVKD